MPAPQLPWWWLPPLVHNERVFATATLPESPFTTKGILFQGTRSYFEQNVPGGYEALLQALSPSYREFMEQPFVAGARYEVMGVPELIEVEATVASASLAAYLDARTRWQAQRDLSGIYRLLVRVAPAYTVIKRVVVVMSQMFNFGLAEASRVSHGEARVVLTGVPSALAFWLEQCLAIYGQVALELGGFPEARCDVLPRTPAQAIEGVHCCDLHVRVRW